MKYEVAAWLRLFLLSISSMIITSTSLPLSFLSFFSIFSYCFKLIVHVCEYFGFVSINFEHVQIRISLRLILSVEWTLMDII